MVGVPADITRDGTFRRQYRHVLFDAVGGTFIYHEKVVLPRDGVADDLCSSEEIFHSVRPGGQCIACGYGGMQSGLGFGEAFEQHGVFAPQRKVVSRRGEEALYSPGHPCGAGEQRGAGIAGRIGVIAYRPCFEQYEEEYRIVPFEKAYEPVHLGLLKWRLPFRGCGRRRDSSLVECGAAVPFPFRRPAPVIS